MKTSNKIILAAVLITLVCLVGYDLLLKAEYMSGDYKIPYKSYVNLPWKDFDIVEVNSSTAVNVQFVQGPFSVKIDGYALEYTTIRQQGKTLQITAGFENKHLWDPQPYLILISCPMLTKVYANATYYVNKHPITDTIEKEGWNMRKVLIDGFKQDSLSIEQDYGSTVKLENNNIRSIHAAIGKSNGSGSHIILEKSNQFDNASLEIGHRSNLELGNCLIHHLDYHLSDSAKLIISGSAHELLNNLNHFRQ
ncbi:MAG: hypothetical protein ACJ751_23670 [Niastella sp.]|uniref:hypothetical protein n=1 Tax=Niastella sp. TaxID=1869183 RepID=UPI0038998432